jgi:hypothetical protein
VSRRGIGAGVALAGILAAYLADHVGVMLAGALVALAGLIIAYTGEDA